MQGEWLFIAERKDKWKTSAVCSCCKKKVATDFKFVYENHQEYFKKENPYCCKCGAKMGVIK